MPQSKGSPLISRPDLPAGQAYTAMLEHEWRTPMTVIQSAAELLRDCRDLTPREREQLLDALIEEAARLHANLELVLSGAAASHVIAAKPSASR